MFNNNVEPLENLIDQFAQFPGIGRKSAVRMAYQVMSMPPKQAMELAKAIEHAKSDLHRCRICQDYTTGDVCKICASQKRDRSIICVVEGPRDIKSIERTHEYNGLYHVLHGLISPMDGIGADQLCIKELLARLNDTVKEVIMATSPTVEGEATAMYIAKLIKPLGIKTTAWPMACPSARVWNTPMRRRCTVPWPDAARCKKNSCIAFAGTGFFIAALFQQTVIPQTVLHTRQGIVKADTRCRTEPAAVHQQAARPVCRLYDGVDVQQRTGTPGRRDHIAVVLAAKVVHTARQFHGLGQPLHGLPHIGDTAVVPRRKPQRLLPHSGGQQVQQEVTADRQAVPGQVVHPGRPQQHGIGQNIQHALLHLLLVAAIDVGGGERCILVKRPVLSKARVDLVRAERNQPLRRFFALQPPSSTAAERWRGRTRPGAFSL